MLLQAIPICMALVMMDVRNGVGWVGLLGVTGSKGKEVGIHLDVDKHAGGLKGLPSLLIYRYQHNKCC